MPLSRTDTTQTLERGLDMLLAFSEERAVMTISQLAEATELPESTVYRLIRTLRHKGLIEQAAPGLYRMGLRTIPMAERALQGLEYNLLSTARPLMFELAQKVGETVVLCALSGEQAVVIATIEGMHPVRVTLESGRTMSLCSGALGKALLANLDPTIRAEIVAHCAAESQEQQGTDLDTIRQDGYAVTDAEITPGLRSIASPIFHRRRLSASIGLIGPNNRITDERLPELIKLVQRAATLASEQLDRHQN